MKTSDTLSKFPSPFFGARCQMIAKLAKRLGVLDEEH